MKPGKLLVSSEKAKFLFCSLALPLKRIYFKNYIVHPKYINFINHTSIKLGGKGKKKFKTSVLPDLVRIIM